MNIFTCKTKYNDEWVYGYYVKSTDNSFLIPENCNDSDFKFIKVDDEAVFRFSGIFDKNRKPIFDGDIIAVYKDDKLDCIATINDSNSYFEASQLFTDDISQCICKSLNEVESKYSIELIGTIFDNDIENAYMFWIDRKRD